MFLKAGALSLALLLASRLLGLLRESAQAAAFGASGVADVVVLMLTLPDWLAGFLASGALAYVLVPAWAGQERGRVAAAQRQVAVTLLLTGMALAVALVVLREPAVRWLAAGVPAQQLPIASAALFWSAIALPAALLAALWTTRLQHERDFTGMYAANLVVNAVLIAAIAVAALHASIAVLGLGLVAAMVLRLVWLHWRIPREAAPELVPAPFPLPAAAVWLWAALSAGLPLALPFAARSIASQDGEGALAVFNYAWKLVELPLILAIQLVATLAFPAIARAIAAGDEQDTRSACRRAFALAWALACAAAAALIAGAPALAALLFGWGRMDAQSVQRIAEWGALGSLGLLPQALIAVALTVLAAQSRMKSAVFAYLAAVVALLLAAAAGLGGGGRLMLLLNVLLTGVAIVVVVALGPGVRAWLPWRSMALSFAGLALVAVLTTLLPPGVSTFAGLVAAGLGGIFVMALTWLASADLRSALAR
jgi:putative peptidoglycan lipid II flippase